MGKWIAPPKAGKKKAPPMKKPVKAPPAGRTGRMMQQMAGGY